MSFTILSKREWQVLELVAQGNPNKTIATLLFISENTLEHHLTRIYQKLGVSGRTAASKWYWDFHDEKK